MGCLVRLSQPEGGVCTLHVILNNGVVDAGLLMNGASGVKVSVPPIPSPVEQYYSSNVQKNQLVQNDIRMAKQLQDEEEQRANRVARQL